jgi:hypothetical protein
MVPDPDMPGTFTIHEELFPQRDSVPSTDYLLNNLHYLTNQFSNQTNLP